MAELEINNSPNIKVSFPKALLAEKCFANYLSVEKVERRFLQVVKSEEILEQLESELEDILDSIIESEIDPC